MRTGFVVRSLTIEGFKGFTQPTKIDVEGRHVFLLGENGNGKSSIIEAVRWGLFGSTNRPNEIVANRDYQTRCRVEIDLLRDGQRFRLKRTLLKGITGRTDAELHDQNGTEVLRSEVMPQLDSVDAGEGMHIIFASQSAPLHRQATDLKPFERTVFNHLGLSLPKALLDRVQNLLVDQECMEDDLGESIDKVREDIESRSDRLQRLRQQSIASPPWKKDDGIPTRSVTEQKTKKFLKDRLGDPLDDTVDGSSLTALLERGRHLIRDQANRSQSELNAQIQPIEEDIEALVGFQSLMTQRDEITTKIRDCVDEINDHLDGATLDELGRRLIKARKDTEAATRRRSIQQTALTLFDDDEDGEVRCPACDSVNSRESIIKALNERLNSTHTTQDDHVEPIEERIESIRRLQQLKKELCDQYDVAVEEARAILNDEERSKRFEDDPNLLKTALTELQSRRDELQALSNNSEDWVNECEAQMSALEEENQFHELQRDITRSDRLRDQLGSVQERLREFSEFGEASRAVCAEIERGLNDALRRDIPKVSDSFTRVFNALTQHPRYNVLRVDDNKLPQLELLVGSNQDLTNAVHSTDVLNGQAESALLLVPYFAFSQDDDAPTEAYLVLLDDPTRAFDEKHIGVLVAQLAELGKHVQLVVASQETRQFKNLVPRYFEESEYVIVEPREWSYESGPEIAIDFPDR